MAREGFETEANKRDTKRVYNEKEKRRKNADSSWTTDSALVRYDQCFPFLSFKLQDFGKT